MEKGPIKFVTPFLTFVFITVVLGLKDRKKQKKSVRLDSQYDNSGNS